MALRSSSISTCLDKKLLILGFEITDLLFLLILIAVLNLIFGPTGMRFLLVWLPTLTIAAILRISKRGKPDNYLLHLARFYALPRSLDAFDSPKEWKTPPRIMPPERSSS
jgi:hypothetical protein